MSSDLFKLGGIALGLYYFFYVAQVLVAKGVLLIIS